MSGQRFKKQGTGSVFKRLGLLFALMVTVIFVVICVIFIQYVNEQRKVEMTTQQSRVINSARVMEQQITAIYNMQLQLTQDSRISQLAYSVYSDNYERSQLVLELYENIKGGRSVNSIVDDILLIFPEEGIQISAENGYSQINPDKEELFSYKQSTKQNRLVYGETVELNISYPITLSADETDFPLCIIRIILSEEYLNKYIDTFRDPFQGAFWVLDQGDEIIRIGNFDPVPETDAVAASVSRATQASDISEEDLMADWSRSWTDADAPDFMSEEILCKGVRYLFVSERLPDYHLTLVTWQNTRALFGNTVVTLFYLGIVLALVGLLFWIVILWANKTVGKPLHKIVNAFETVRAGNLKVRIYHKNNDEFGYIYASFNEMVEQIETLIENIREQSVLLQNAELMQLQSQINPHFLYNSFYIIKFMARKEDYEQIEDFVTSLAAYYRFLNKETNQVIPLAAEVEHMNNYIDIQQMRFGDKITVQRQELPEDVKSFKVPKLILQPVIENAYGYGLASLLADGRLNISYRMEDKILYIDIEDNGDVLTSDVLERMRENIYAGKGEALNHALANIHRRILLAFGQDNGVLLDIGSMGGLKVTLRLDTSILLK